MRLGWMLICAALLLLACGDDEKNKINAPANLTAEVVAEDRVTLNWEDRSGNEVGFEVQRALPGEAFRILTRTGADRTTVNDATVTLGEIYHYRVRAVGGKERSFYSNRAEVEVVVDRATAPTAPESLQASEVTHTTLTLTWVDTTANETAFEIERSLDEDFAEAETLAADMNETRYEDSALTPETQYYYRIRAINAIGESPYSQPLAVLTAARPLTPPQAPTDLTASAESSSRISLEWNDASNNETGFILMVSTDGSAFEALHTTARNVHSHVHGGLSPETTYVYYVIAFNSAGESENSAVAQATTQPETVVPPTTPVDLTYSDLTSNSVRLTWTDSSGNEEGFRLERSQTDDFALVDAILTDPNTTTYHDNNLLPATTYYYRIIAFNTGGDSEYSQSVEMLTPEEIVPLPAPSALTVQDNTPVSITLGWQDNSNAEEGFRIFYSTDGGQTFTALDTAAANMTTYTHSGLDPETTYLYRVNAFLEQQTSDYSNTLTATTDPLPPDLPQAPSLLEATGALANSITLNWQDNSDNEAGFSLERSDNEAFTDATIIDIGANQTEYTDTGLTPETIYYFRIRAYNADGNSDYSESISQTTTSLPPV